MSDSSPGYTAVEIAEGALGGLNAIAVGAAIFPGFLLTAPGIVLALLPVIALTVLAAVLALAVALATIPAVLAWKLANVAVHAVPAPHVPRVPAFARRARANVGRPAL